MDKIDQIDRRLDQLEHKVAQRKIWTDLWHKALPPFLFMISAAIVLIFSTPDWPTKIAAATFACGAWLMILFA